MTVPATAASPPYNDDLADAGVIYTPFQDWPDMTDAELEENEVLPCAIGAMDRSVWYSWTVPSDGRFAIEIGWEQDTVSAAVYGPYEVLPTAVTGVGDPAWCIYGTGSDQALRENVLAGEMYLIQLSTLPGWGAYLSVNLGPLPPPNDNQADAIVIGELPFEDWVDLAGATLEQDEYAYCNYSSDTQTVWYAYTPPADANIVIEIGAESGEAFAAILGDSIDGHWCLHEDSQNLIRVNSGETYLIQLSISAWGSWLAYLRVEPGPPILDVVIALGESGSVNRVSGGALVTGTITCNLEASGWGYVSLRQRLNRTTVASGGAGFTSLCGPEPTTFEVWIYAEAPFAPGSAEASAYFEAHDGAQWAWTEASSVIKLRPMKQ